MDKPFRAVVCRFKLAYVLFTRLGLVCPSALAGAGVFKGTTGFTNCCGIDISTGLTAPTVRLSLASGCAS
jgi:hypothetical protein